MTGLDYSIVIIFLVVMAGGGFTVSRLIKDSDDFFVAGRELTPFILCATITATNLSMFHFIGFGGTAYQNGVSIIWQNWTGDMALVLSGVLIIPLMRRLRIRSVPELLQIRYGSGLRVLIGLFWALRLSVYLGILLYLAATAAGVVTGYKNYAVWLMAFSLISILYSVVGGAWAVALMDSVQFVFMLLGALITFPIAMAAVGGLPNLIQWLNESGHSNHLRFVPQHGEFNWLFIMAITLLSIKWATVDQAILQRAFGARTPRMAAKGMVLAGIITTPFAFFWILPGLAATKLSPGFTNPDLAIPTLLTTQIPGVLTGLLGVVLCGLIAAQISTITADVNSVATLLTSDVYRLMRRTVPTQRELVIVVRISSLLCGILMLVMAWYLQFSGAGAVRANLAMVGILDMPLFVVTIIYGLFWKRANWQGATAGFIIGGTVGILCYVLIDPKHFNTYLAPLLSVLPAGLTASLTDWHGSVSQYKKNLLSIAPIASSLTALVVCPVVSLLTPKGEPRHEAIWASRHTSGGTESLETDVDDFHFIPRSLPGKIGLAAILLGFAGFVLSTITTPLHPGSAAAIAITCMIAVLGGGLLRVYSK